MKPLLTNKVTTHKVATPKVVTQKIILMLLALAGLGLLQGCSHIIGASTAEPIEDNPKTRSVGAFVDDEIIETKAKVNIRKADPALADAHINVTSYNGVVLLSGEVGSEDLRQLAAATTAKVGKVKRVHNELVVAGNSSMLARSNDTWITSKLKSKLLINKLIQGRRIKVVTESGTVFLMGLLSDEEGARAAEVARKTSGVQRVVTLYE